MTTAYARAQYEEMQVQTSQGKLVVMLYDGLLRFLHLGLNALRRGDLETQGVQLGKATNILCELMATLDFSAGPIAQDLYAIYDYCMVCLLNANAGDRPEYLEEIIALLTPLRDAWEEAERTLRAQEAMTPALAGTMG
jgi:flagellar protein FliS